MCKKKEEKLGNAQWQD